MGKVAGARLAQRKWAAQEAAWAAERDGLEKTARNREESWAADRAALVRRLDALEVLAIYMMPQECMHLLCPQYMGRIQARTNVTPLVWMTHHVISSASGLQDRD